ncbi:MAG: alpha-glucan family phosphorylase [Bacteroidales bacterium]|nr:alpha-glucan family phosphorylase [Bacteroidales bacterium]
MILPHYLFEISWEVCQKVGGIHTVLATKASLIQSSEHGSLGDRYIFIGPDLWREEKANPEFIEMPELFQEWKQHAIAEGIRIKVGTWKIDKPQIAILVDFTGLYSKKDEIFKSLWEEYRLDSITGQWDYIEPALFGYAAGMVIESFINFYLHIRERAIAHFHEWMTGSGVLYLKQHCPQAGTIFTTHATVLGRCLAGNGRKLYGQLGDFQPEITASEFNVTSKYSLERNAALHADVFTTVSSITANECKYLIGRAPDIVTPNGFNLNIVPPVETINDTRKFCRDRLLKLAEIMQGPLPAKESVLVGTSGRYEFRNKGIDMFIDSLMLAANSNPDKNIIAYVLVPAYNQGPDKEIVCMLENEAETHHLTSKSICSHILHDYDNDPLVRRLRETGMPDNLFFVFIPAYLNGNDGILNKHYYEVLPGLDLTIFASYYEPWGYTPLESIAFYVPTVTTSLAGFGAWIQSRYPGGNQSCYVVNRDDDNYQEAVNELASHIASLEQLNCEQHDRLRSEAHETSKTALWQNLIVNYFEAFRKTLEIVESRKESFIHIRQTGYIPQFRTDINQPDWQSIEVAASLPEEFNKLRDIMMNIWWSWNTDVVDMFQMMDPELWEKHKYNPIKMLKDISEMRFAELVADEEFHEVYNRIVKKYETYMSEETYKKAPHIAYFSMEYGFNDNLKIFSGGLGILAGDYLKEASDSEVNMTGIGLLYRNGYFKQKLSVYGEQLSEYTPQRFSNLPISAARNPDGSWAEVSIVFPGRIVYARIWMVNIGRNKLYLLDTDFEKNQENDREITYQLYGGDNENRLKQEMILGIGGIRLIRLLQLRPDMYHVNEGHAAFIGLERLRVLMHESGLTFSEALDYIRASSLFTTHTPVPAGHDVFDEDLMRTYMFHYPERFNITWDDFMNLGKASPADKKFSMSYLAANFSQEINGVSLLHGHVSRGIFHNLYHDFLPEELHISYATNGVHYKSWTAPKWQEFYINNLGEDIDNWLSDTDRWKILSNVPDSEIWSLRQQQRQILVDYLHKRIRKFWVSRFENPKNMISVLDNLKPQALTIAFARRFATYKRAHLLFKNIERLKEIVNNPKQPVQFIFAGKAHPNDKAGQDLIKYIVEISKQPEFLGKIIFLENYDINLAKRLVQGVDIWLNTPTRPLEASGTSGMKAVLNGVLHFSVLDGWWVEGYKKGAGWALPKERTYQNQDFQDELDSESIYSMLENEIIPMFYNRNAEGVPEQWVGYIKKSISEVAPQFTTRRMLQDYFSRFYNKLYKRSKQLKADNYQLLSQLNRWKKYITARWKEVELVSLETNRPEAEMAQTGDIINMHIAMNLNGIKPDDVQIELIITENFFGHRELIGIEEAKLIEEKSGIHYFTISTRLFEPGTINYALRIVPRNDLIPYKADFNLIKWL